jgi:transposase
VVIPARPYKARDKAKVESMVLVVQRWILARLRNCTFFSLDDLNVAISKLLEELNARQLQKLGVSRRELFERLERGALKPLPVSRYEMAQWTTCRVNIDYHVEVERHPYSVPYQLIGEEMEVRYTSMTVEIFFKGKRLDSHRRRYDHQPSTKSEHMPSAHRAHAEWTPSRLIHWAEKTGPATGRLVEGILKSRPHPEQGYRACLGLMRLGRKYGPERLESASARAEHLRSYSYLTVKNILAAAQDRLPLEAESAVVPVTPVHENIRGADYYAAPGEKNEC